MILPGNIIAVKIIKLSSKIRMKIPFSLPTPILEYNITLPTATQTLPGRYFPTSEKKNIFMELIKLILLPTDFNKTNVGIGRRKKPIEINPMLTKIDQILLHEKDIFRADNDLYTLIKYILISAMVIICKRRIAMFLNERRILGYQCGEEARQGIIFGFVYCCPLACDYFTLNLPRRYMEIKGRKLTGKYFSPSIIKNSSRITSISFAE